jgi:diguanylate cyclase (GGDEF)-like protein
MSPFQSSLFKGSGSDLFTPVQVQQLMRVEFDRAKRHGHPLVMLLISVDRLAQLQDLYGSELRDSVLRSIAGLVRSASRSSDSLGCLLDDRLLLLTPHTPAEGAGVLAKRILESVRALSFESGGRPTRVTISIGGAHNQSGRMELAFETLLEVAEGGLKVAVDSGGNRYVHSDLYDYFEQRRQREQREREKLQPQAPIPASAERGGERAAERAPPLPPPPLPPTPREEPALTEALLGAKIRELFGLGAGEDDMLARIQREVVASALREMKGEIERALGQSQSEHQRQIDTLERRIQKLTQSLGMTEAELRRALAQTNVDPGVASLYRNVQGLSSADVQQELKKELMSKIFQANLELRKQITPGTPEGGSGA